MDEMIFSYRRSDALEDGVLVDVSDTAKFAGFKFPVAVNDTVWAMINNFEPGSGQDLNGRLWDVLWLAVCAIKKSSANDTRNGIYFDVILAPYTVRLRMVCGPGDNMEPVITIMGEHED